MNFQRILTTTAMTIMIGMIMNGCNDKREYSPQFAPSMTELRMRPDLYDGRNVWVAGFIGLDPEDRWVLYESEDGIKYDMGPRVILEFNDRNKGWIEPDAFKKYPPRWAEGTIGYSGDDEFVSIVMVDIGKFAPATKWN